MPTFTAAAVVTAAAASIPYYLYTAVVQNMILVAIESSVSKAWYRFDMSLFAVVLTTKTAERYAALQKIGVDCQQAT